MNDISKNNKNKLSRNSRLLNVFLSIIFVVFALVQLNDPDPWVWFTIYFLVAAGLIASIFIRLPAWTLYLAVAGLLLFAGSHASYFLQWLSSDNLSELFGEMPADKHYLEGTREFLGLLIALAAILYMIIQNRNRE